MTRDRWGESVYVWGDIKRQRRRYGEKWGEKARGRDIVTKLEGEERERLVGEKGRERKEDRGCERVKKGRERDMDLEGDIEGGKKKDIERERWRERE